MEKTKFDWKYLIPIYGLLVIKKSSVEKKKNFYVLNVVLSIFILGLFGNINRSPDMDKQKLSENTSSTEIINSQNKNFIPGLTQADITLNLQKKGFTVEKKYIQVSDSQYWLCSEKNENHDFTVEIFGKSFNEIYKIEATALNYSTKSTAEVVREFLAYVASVPYDNSNPQIAYDWVINNVDNNITKIIGSVKYEIIFNQNSPRARILTITLDQ